MIFDEEATFASGRALNLYPVGTTLFGSVIDLGSVFATAAGDGLHLRLRAASTATSAGAATAQFFLVSDSAAAILTDGSASHHLGTRAIPVASIVAGSTLFSGILPPGPFERYMGLLIVVSGDVFTGGSVDAALTPAPHDWKPYRAGF